MTPRRVLLIATAVAAALWGRHRMATWGTTPEERDRPMPGDGLVPDPLTQVTRAVRIAADTSARS